MMKKIIFGTLAFAIIIVTVPLFSAFEAHVINVTAKIENALQIRPDAITFGTVFPQEQLDRVVTIALSESAAQSEIASVEYMIKQKPKCAIDIGITGEAFAQATEDAQGNFVCPENYHMLPLLCPYLSKHSPKTNDTSIPAFHGPLADWTDAISNQFKALGKLTKTEPSTDWTIDLKVPCFAGMCAQDWEKFVTGINPNVNAAEYIQPADMEHAIFGCDLWFETTGIRRGEELPVCVPTTEVLDGADNNCNGLIDETLFMSEYVEGSDTNKALEIYNPTGSDVNLNGYAIQSYVNGSPTASATYNLPNTTLASGHVFVICNSGSSGLPPTGKCDALTNSNAIDFNGDDALVLSNGLIALDIIGQVGNDPGTEWGSGLISTADNTIVRNCAITHGDVNGADAFDPATEWIGNAIDTFSNLGSHNLVCP